MKQKAFKIGLLIIGIFLMVFPIVYSMGKDTFGISEIYKYKSRVITLNDKEIEDKYKSLQEYNNKVISEFKADVSINNQSLIAKNEVLGYINIPKINVYLPIYAGSSKKELDLGVGHLENTSMPIGGNGTHCVLAGHTGIRRTKIFDDIHNLDIGDRFYISVLNRKLEYRVDNIQTVNPDDTSAIKLEKNQDYVTLLTCTPRGKNTQRLLVRGTREEQSDKIDAQKNNLIKENTRALKLIRKNEVNMLAIIMCGIIAIIVLSAIIIRR